VGPSFQEGRVACPWTCSAGVRIAGVVVVVIVVSLSGWTGLSLLRIIKHPDDAWKLSLATG
jgi:hypothetical protein